MSIDLFVKGKLLKKDGRAIAVVGSRQASARGIALTKLFVAALVKQNFTIVSGLARGIDTAAHTAALASGGRTVAVLGSGIDIIYPPENTTLADEVVKNGALVSPFANGTKPEGPNFLARNKIIVALSLGVLVIEGKRRSGTLSTAAHAANEGKDVFAIPGSEATDWLIDQGANSVKSPEELLNFL